MTEFTTLKQSIIQQSNDYVKEIADAQDTFTQNSAARQAVGGHISAMSEKLVDIQSSLKEVKSISKQVKLLSFNASIEAARAGAAGSGFSVVASEVGKLSERTDDAVHHIEESIHQLTSLLQETVTDMQNAKALGAQFDEKLEHCVACAQQLDDNIKNALKE